MDINLHIINKKNEHFQIVSDIRNRHTYINIKLTNTVNNDTVVLCTDISQAKQDYKYVLVCSDDHIEDGLFSYMSFFHSDNWNDYDWSNYRSVFKTSSGDLSEIKDNFMLCLSLAFPDKETFMSELSVVAEELMMNAFFNAPVEKGEHIYKNSARTDNIVLNNKVAEAELLLNEDCAVIRCRDYFGTLSKNAIIGYLQKISNMEVNTQNPNSKGAEIGLGLVYYYSDVLIFNVKEGIYTEVISIKYHKEKKYKLVGIVR